MRNIGEGVEIVKIEMSRNVRIKVYDVIATISFPEERTEIISLLQMANQYDILSANRVVDKKVGLLPGRPSMMGSRLLHMAAGLGLLEQKRNDTYVMTDKGKDTLIDEEIFIPEESAWKIWITEDPIFPSKILHLERHDDKFKHSKQQKKVQKIPNNILKIKDLKVELLRSHHTGSNDIRIEEIKPNGRLSDSDVSLDLVITADIGNDANARIQGKIGNGKGSQIDRLIPFEAPSHLELFTHLVNQSDFESDWNYDERVLEISFANASISERRDHLKEIIVDNPILEDLGKFKSVKLKNIPLKPKTGSDAREWAEWEFWNNLSEHPWPDIAEVVWNEISQRYGLKSYNLSSLPDISLRVDKLSLSMSEQLISAKEIIQLRQCQAIIDIGGDY